VSPVALFSLHTCPLAALGGKETGGMNVYVRELARELGRVGFEVDVFTRSQDAAIPEVVSLGPGARVVHVPAGPARPLPRPALVEHLDAFVAGVERFRRRERRDYAVLHSHYWLSGVAALELAARWRRPVIQMFHTLGALKNAVARSEAEREPEARVAAEQRIVAAADRIVAANPVERAHLGWYYGADVERVRVIPCGVDLDLFQPADPGAARARLGLRAQHVLLFVGRLAPIKGLETLLRALAAAKANGLGGSDVRLVVVGGDKDERWDRERTALRELAAALGVGRWVDFRGPQPQATLPDYYAAADLCVMPSLYESFGMVALEAMACGVPVIGSRVGGLTETVQDDVTGVLVPEGDTAALAAAIAGLLPDRERRRRLGAEAVERAKRFGWPCIARAVIELYGELVPAFGDAARRSPCESFI
jgi:D-inositol-3-phosphate glycosyltransferase